MKYCEEYAALLDLYADAELTADEMQRVEAHLAECPACRAYVDDALAIRAAFADLEDVEIPEGFAESVCAAIRADAAPRKKAKKTAHWGRVLASLAACCAIVILLRNGPIAGKGNSSDAMMKSVNTSAAFDTAASTESAPAEAECVADDAMLFSAQDCENYVEDTTANTALTTDPSAGMPETAEETVAGKQKGSAESGSTSSLEDRKETAVEEPQSTGSGTNMVSDEFSVWIDGQSLKLGAQTGTFPWGTALQAKGSRTWSSDGFACFEIVCEDGTILQGLRREGAEDEADGTITQITTENPAWQTWRGAYIGMPLDEFLALYPDAARRENAGPGDHSYSYSDELPGSNQLVVWFESGTLSSFTLANGLDGFLY